MPPALLAVAKLALEFFLAVFFIGLPMSFFSHLKQGLERSRIQLAGLFSGAVIDEAFFEELEETLIAADVGIRTTTDILKRLRDTVKLQGLRTPEQVKLALRDEIAARLASVEKTLQTDTAKPLVLMMVGVNGAGKTTSIGKIAKWFASQGKTVLLAAGDTFRAAAREQLDIWAERNKIDVIAQTGGDPAAVAFDAIAAARARGTDVIIVDTAGRLPTQTHLMAELARVRRAAGKAMTGAPHEILLVVDGTTGQNALTQVTAFDQAADLTGLIVTKLDGSAKGGVLVAIAEQNRQKPLPIYFIGVGEQIDDLQPFQAHSYADALLGIERG